jgi:HK97 family phage major capsid protein
MKTLLSTFLTANLQVSGAVVIMSQRLALAISMMQNALGQSEYPNLTMNGGTAWGLPVITSEGVPSTGGSPTDGDTIIVASTPDILLADDGQVSIDVSREATLQMDSAPDSPPTASTVMYSLFQNNGVAIRAERYINWAKRRSTAVAYHPERQVFRVAPRRCLNVQNAREAAAMRPLCVK